MTEQVMEKSDTGDSNNKHKILKFNSKMRQSIRDTGFLNVWEGSARSSKTTVSMAAFHAYVIGSKENVFAMAGYTLETLMKNCVLGDFGFLELFPWFELKTIEHSKGTILAMVYKPSGSGMHVKTIYLVSYNTGGAVKRLHGLTLGGMYIDEVDQASLEYIQESFTRTFASRDERFFWTLNPNEPDHYVYTHYIDKYRDEDLPGYHWWHCTLNDNPAITEEKKAALERQHSGVFYERYILGMRVRPEGRIYEEYNDNTMVIDEVPKDVKFIVIDIGVDYYGGNEKMSATTHALVGYTEGFKKVYILDEFYDNSTMDLGGIRDNFKQFVLKCKASYPTVSDSYHDPANRFIWDLIRKDNYGVNVKASKKIEIINRIRILKTLMKNDRLRILRHCVNTRDAINKASWDPKNPGKRLDNGSAKIDSLDAMEYSLERHYKEMGI